MARKDRKVLLFGEGCQKVNLSEMAKAVGTNGETLRQWRGGKFPKALTVFARICDIRGLEAQQIGEIIQTFK